MPKIESLTREQQSSFPEFAEKWSNIRISTEPVVKSEAIIAITKAYEAINLAPPPNIIFCQSSFEMNEKIKEFGYKNTMFSLLNLIYDEVLRLTRNFVMDAISYAVWENINDMVCTPIYKNVLDIEHSEVARKF